MSLGGALAVGVTVVTVSGGSAAVGGGADGVVAAGGADVVAAGCVVVGVGGAMVVDTEPLSPPPRMTTVQITATSRIAPATPAIHIHRRSIGS